MQEIQIKIEKGLPSLSGNSYGRKVYLEQFKYAFEKDRQICVIIPDQVERIGISFVQGFIHDIAEKYGKGNVQKYITITS